MKSGFATSSYSKRESADLPTARHSEESRTTDLNLMRRLAQGDESALATLYDRYAGLVYSVARRVLGDAGAAEEVMQDLFYQLWWKARDYDAARGGLGAWLLVSARNRAIDRLRQRKRAEALAPEQVAPLAFDLESSVAQAELISRVKSALGGLSESQRQALELAYFEGMTHSEISQRTGEPLGTVKTRLRAALQALRQVLNP